GSHRRRNGVPKDRYGMSTVAEHATDVISRATPFDQLPVPDAGRVPRVHRDRVEHDVRLAPPRGDGLRAVWTLRLDPEDGAPHAGRPPIGRKTSRRLMLRGHAPHIGFLRARDN